MHYRVLAHFHSGVKARIITNDVLALLKHLSSLPTMCQVLLPLGMNWGEKSQLAVILNIKELEDWGERQVGKRYLMNYVYTLELKGKRGG